MKSHEITIDEVVVANSQWNLNHIFALTAVKL